MFQLSASDTMKVTQTNKQKTIITTYKEFLGTCIKSKKNKIYSVYINY